MITMTIIPLHECSVCGKDFVDYNLRPYGKDGAAICFKCAFATPETKARTEAMMHGRLDEIEAAGFDVSFDKSGPVPLTRGKS